MPNTDWFMPAEWEEHERTWMAWPSSGYTLGDTPEDWLEARSTWAAVANAIIEFEPVSMLCEPEAVAIAKTFLDPRVELIEAPLDDAWMRDIGPTFVKNSSGEVAGVDWVFNGWGAQKWASWQKDSKVAELINRLSGTQNIASTLINEGGGLHVNGTGTVLLTETVQLGEGRNSTWSREAVENEIHNRLGTKEAVWIRRGLTRDYDEFGTRGHVDIVACFASPTKILFHNQEDPSHPDFSVSHEVKRTLEEHGGFELIPVAAPKTLRDEESFVDYSYINHYLVNGGVILCGFNDENDSRAVETLQAAYPDRKIVLVDARPLFARGGGIHCITQQQPARETA
jgi:agmatine deiminase